jgi:hypothetical protein
MWGSEFSVIARQIEEILAELKAATSPSLRRSKLSEMRRLIGEADRLAAEDARSRKTSGPTDHGEG